MKVLYLFNKVLGTTVEEAQQGIGHDSWLFGMLRLRKLGISADFLEIEKFIPQRWAKLLRKHILTMHFAHVPLFPFFFRHDIVFTSTAYGSLFLKACLKKFLRIRGFSWVMLDFNITGTIGEQETLKQKIFAWSVRNGADGIVTISSAEAEVLKVRFPHLAHAIIFLHEATDTSYFAPMPDVRERNMVLSVGNFGRDFDTLIEAMRDERLASTELILATKLIPQERIATLPPNVKVQLFKHDEIRRVYAEAKVVAILIGLKDDYFDSVGTLSLGEAMSMGKAVIATRTKSMESYVDDGKNAIFVPHKDVVMVRSALIELLGQSPEAVEDRRSLGRHARAFAVEHLDANKFAARLADYFKETIIGESSLAARTIQKVLPFGRNKKILALGFILGALVWISAHIPGVMYGTQNLPLHQSYVGDEQSPVNGALHMLQDKSIFGLRNEWTVYYGPIFSVLAVPAVLVDAGTKYLGGVARTAEEYKNSILSDWGTIVVAARSIAVLFSALALVAIYSLIRRGGQGTSWVYAGLITVALVACNYYFFEYSHFFKHWIFMLAALAVQWASLRYIVERRGTIWWVIHGAATLFAAGISIFSLINLSMWLPVLIRWIRSRSWIDLKYFVRLSYVLIIGILLIVLWHPLIFFRYFSMAGVGTAVAGTLGQQNPLMFSGESIGYYLNLILFNHAPLILGLAVLCFALRKARLFRRYETWMILLPGLLSFAFFAPAPHFEGRYMLPTILSFLVFTGFVVGEYMHSVARRKLATVVVSILLGLYGIFHIVHIAGWIDVYAQGPIEKVMLRRVLEQSAQGKTNVLIVQNYISGHVHTKEAYQRYMKDFNKSGFNLYKTILEAPSPRDKQLLNATYMLEKEYFATEESPARISAGYDQVVWRRDPRPNSGEINQFDYVDENIMRIWRYGEVMPGYVYVK